MKFDVTITGFASQVDADTPEEAIEAIRKYAGLYSSFSAKVVIPTTCPECGRECGYYNLPLGCGK